MVFGERQFAEAPKQESMGHLVEHKVGEFLGSVFECVERIEATENNGINDGHGIDVVVVFKNGKKLAIDITMEDKSNPRFIAKWASMMGAPMAVIKEERNENDEVVVEKTDERIPKAIIRVDSNLWEECIGYETLDYVPEALKIKLEKEKKEITNQIIQQIEFVLKQLKGDKEYQKKAKVVTQLLKEELEQAA